MAIVVLTGCATHRDRALVSEYHRAVIAHEEGRAKTSAPYSLELEQALRHLASRGDVRYQLVTFPDIPHSRTNVAALQAIVQPYYRHVIDAAIPYVPRRPLQLELYYYPDQQEHIDNMLKEINAGGQEAAAFNIAPIEE